MSQSSKQQEMLNEIERLKKLNRSATQTDNPVPVDTDPRAKGNRLRVTAEGQRIDSVSRATFIRSVIRQLILGELSQGEALRNLRIEVLGLKQDKYAQLVAVSRKTISDIENNKGNYSVEVMNKVFRPFGLRMGLVPMSPSLLNAVLNPEP